MRFIEGLGTWVMSYTCSDDALAGYNKKTAAEFMFGLRILRGGHGRNPSWSSIPESMATVTSCITRTPTRIAHAKTKAATQRRNL